MYGKDSVSPSPHEHEEKGVGVTLPALDSCWLPGWDVEMIEQVGCGDPQNQRGHFSLAVILCDFVPDCIRNRVRAVGEAGHRFGERQGGPFRVREIGRIAPGGYGEQALVALVFPLVAARARGDTEATAVDLAGA